LPRRLLIAAALAAIVGLALASAGQATVRRPAARACGLTPRIDGQRYDVREVRGKVSCRTVKRVVTRYLRTSKVSRPWTCTLGHGSSPYAASCARGTKVLVRVYAPG
jgi:hypothetical protein